MRPVSDIRERMARLRAQRLKDSYVNYHTPDPSPEETAESLAEAEERGDEPIVVDLDVLQDPYDIKAGIVWTHPSGIDPEIEREAVARMNDAHSERTEKIQELRRRGGRVGPRLPGQYFSYTSSGVTIENPEANRRAWARRSRKEEKIPYALPGENFEQAARRHLGFRKSSELLEMQARTRAEMEPQEISDPFKVRDEPRDARAEQPRHWDSAEEEQSRLGKIARAVGLKEKKIRSKSAQAKAQPRDQHGRFTS
jgi:hypothetical protein